MVGCQPLQKVRNSAFFMFGAIAKRLCNGLQIRVARFDSGSRLQILKPLQPCRRGFLLLYAALFSVASMVKLVDTADLKSAAFP